MSNKDGESEGDFDEQQIVQAILELGNEILRNLGVEERIDDLGVFFGDAFYIQFFQAAFPDIDFSNLQEADTEEGQAENIQNLIDLLGGQILRYDLSHIRGSEIVNGNPEHCINLLQLVQEISVMLDNRQGQQDSDEEGNGLEDQSAEEEDDEAQIIHEKKKKEQQQQQQLQEQQQRPQQQNPKPQDSNKKSQEKRGRSYSDDRGGKDLFDLEDGDISNDFNVKMDEDDEDEDEDVKQLHNQIRNPNQQQQQQENEFEDDYQDDDDDEEIDENDLKMYEQFLAQNKQEQQQLAMMGQQEDLQNQDSQFEDDDDEENAQEQQKQQQRQQQQQLEVDDEDDDDQEIDLDNIDYDQIDPQILELAEKMQVHPKEILKQMLQLQNEGYGDEDEEDEEEMDEDALREQLNLAQQKELSSKQKQADQQKQVQQQQQQQQQQNQQPKKQQQQVQRKPLPHELIQVDSDQESYYSENELITRDKLANRQTYSAPYIILNDCFDEPLCDSESEKELESANTTGYLKNIEYQEQLAEQMANEEVDPKTAQLLKQQQEQQEMIRQQQMMQQQQQQQQYQQQQQQQKQNSRINESNQSNQNKNKQISSSDQKKQQARQQQIFNDEDDDDEELDIDVGQKLQQLKNQQNDEEDDNQEGEGEYDEDMLVDLDQLDDTNKQMLLEYLQQEYEKNPDQFPFPKELLEQQQQNFKKQQESQKRQDTESVRDIKSDEMIVEENSQQQNNIVGGEQEIEQQDDYDEDEEISPEQQQQFQQMQMLMQQQQQYQNQNQQDEDYGEEQDDNQLDEIQQQMLLQYQQQQMMQQQQQQQQKAANKKPKAVKKGLRPKSAGVKKKTQQPQMIPPAQLQANQLPYDQQQQLIEYLRQNGIDAENNDPNLEYIQQMILAQQQQEMESISQSKSTRPRTAAKRNTSLNKKKPQLTSGKNMKKLMPYQMPKSIRGLGPITPSTQYKSFNTNRSYNQTFSKKKRPKSSGKKQALSVNPSQNQYQVPQEQFNAQPFQQYEMPVYNEEYLNQLSEEQLQELLEQQKQMMMLNQQQANQINTQMKKSLRPKSAKTTKSLKQKIPQTYATYNQPFLNLKKKNTLGKGKKKKKKRITIQQQFDHQGVLMNNYFPALESGNQLIANSQLTEEGTISKDSKYPKFSNELANNPNILAAGPIQQDQIDEVSPEQEEGESQEIIQRHPNFYPQKQQLQQQFNQVAQDQDGEYDDDQQHDQDQDIEQDHLDQDQQDPTGEQDDTDNQQQEIELTDEQLIQLIQNAHNLSPEQQLQLQQILQHKMKNEIMNERAQSYQNIYQILMDNVRKAKDRLAHLAHPHGSIDDVEETDRRILKQKQEFEALYRQYHMEMKQKEMRKKQDESKSQKKIQREVKIQTIKEKKFQDELLNHQKSLNYKRNAQQVRLCQKVYKLASELEKNKLLAEKKDFKENIQKKKQQSKLMVDALENFYKNMITMLKEKIENEKFERRIASQAQQQVIQLYFYNFQAMSRMKRELNHQKKQEVERYLQLLKQEDERYDFESTNLQKMEQEIIKLYQK
ncbi:UNKNOWN [Stylonychia lemnae]|uniref:DUF5745 domain-containing protein n=1 Tax=Stylonychia lemnae TaxID=5949 RepID=A0A078AMM9_STYLE|nr:UNKNOWN [Stylonychia lemnae]|eukprot:CDW83414.1 UNKNOWN [Stylonychia lemnae]